MGKGSEKRKTGELSLFIKGICDDIVFSISTGVLYVMTK